MVHDDGKLLKKNTFTDFIDCSKYVIQYNYTSAETICMQKEDQREVDGVIVNEAPELCGVIAQVPFVDVMTTMLDDSIPLTTGEYDEWGIQIRRSITTTCDHLMIT
jgi:oligopeptidase B